MSSMTTQKLANIVADLSNEDLRRLIEMAASRVIVYVGTVGNRCVLGEIESASLNGNTVQLNLTTDLDRAIEAA